MWSVVARFTSVGEAESARSALDAAGIDARVGDENMVAVDWLMSQAVGGVKVLVPDEKLAEAAEVLGDAAREATSDEHEEVRAEARPTSLREPIEDGVQRIPRLKLFLALAVVAIGLGAATHQAVLSGILIAVVGLVLVLTAQEPERGKSYGPLPEASEIEEPLCPRCGSREYYRVTWRRLRASSMILELGAVLIVPLWLVLPKWKCETCGLRRSFR